MMNTTCRIINFSWSQSLFSTIIQHGNGKILLLTKKKSFLVGQKYVLFIIPSALHIAPILQNLLTKACSF